MSEHYPGCGCKPTPWGPTDKEKTLMKENEYLRTMIAERQDTCKFYRERAEKLAAVVDKEMLDLQYHGMGDHQGPCNATANRLLALLDEMGLK